MKEMIHYSNLELISQEKIERDLYVIEVVLFMIPDHKDALARLSHLVKKLDEEIDILSEKTWGHMRDIHRELSTRCELRNRSRSVYVEGSTTHNHVAAHVGPIGESKHDHIRVL